MTAQRKPLHRDILKLGLVSLLTDHWPFALAALLSLLAWLCFVALKPAASVPAVAADWC